MLRSTIGSLGFHANCEAIKYFRTKSHEKDAEVPDYHKEANPRSGFSIPDASSTSTISFEEKTHFDAHPRTLMSKLKVHAKKDNPSLL